MRPFQVPTAGAQLYQYLKLAPQNLGIKVLPQDELSEVIAMESQQRWLRLETENEGQVTLGVPSCPVLVSERSRAVAFRMVMTCHVWLLKT